MKTVSFQAILFVFLISLFGCASVNNALTPSAKIIQDKFDNTTIIRQKPVSAATSPSEGWNTLGFEWMERYPDIAFLYVGVEGINNVFGVQFNADGQLIRDIRRASLSTEYDNWSTRRFAIAWSDFLTISNANDVRMKVDTGNAYTVSSFGPANSGAVVNAKIPPFVKMVEAIRRGN